MSSLHDQIPDFNGQPSQSQTSDLSGMSGGIAVKSVREVIAIALFAVFVIGGLEGAIRLFNISPIIMPTPSSTFRALFTEMPYIAPHLGHTVMQLLMGYAIGASVGIVLAAIITQFPFVEKIITPYILLLVTTPMLALVPLLIINFGFGYTPRVIAVALAVGPMVMINSATGFRRVDLAKIALAESYGASTFQVFSKIRIPMAMPMIIVGLMIGAIFGLLTVVGAEMVGGGFGLGNRLTTYSAVLRMPEFFACVLILALMGILIYSFFFWLGKKLTSWDS